MDRWQRPGVVVAAAMLLVGTAACGPPTPPAGPDPAVVVPRLFEPALVYRELGYLASDSPLVFVGTVRHLATASPDTTLSLVAVSLASEVLAFRRSAAGYEARYIPEILVRQEGRVVARQRSLERVRVPTRAETRRADESIVFQQILYLAPGAYDLTVTIRDEETGTVGRVEQPIAVPRFEPPALTDPIAVHRGSGRGRGSEPPRVLLNPRATAAFGLDSLRLYVEAYAVPDSELLRVTLETPAGDSIAVTETPLVGSEALRWAITTFGPDELPVGELTATASIAGVPTAGRSRALVTFSDQWAVTNVEEILSLLRYFGYERELAAVRDATPTDRPALWRAFWQRTDPNPVTPENERLAQYFRRVQEANQRFREAGEAGWTTERGEVYITLGEPDEVFEGSMEFQGTGRTVRWNFVRQQLVLDFVDDTGFGRYRLTPRSRAEFERARNELWSDR